MLSHPNFLLNRAPPGCAEPKPLRIKASGFFRHSGESRVRSEAFQRYPVVTRFRTPAFAGDTGYVKLTGPCDLEETSIIHVPIRSKRISFMVLYDNDSL
jgi:hypothetical protein